MENIKLIQAISSVLMVNEALASPHHKAMATRAAAKTANSAGDTAAEQISKPVMPTDRITIPLERTAKPNKDVVAHLNNNGYHANDYQSGLTSHKDTPDRKIKIGKVLGMTDAHPDIRKSYETDPARSGVKTESEHKIVISRRPADIAAMSTHQRWQSCQTLGGTAKFKDSRGVPTTSEQEKGSHTEYVPSTIAAGSHVAYLVKDEGDVDKHMGPIARVMLNTYIGNSGHKILRPSNTYGQPWSGFHDTVQKWAETNFPAKDAHYVRHSGAYPEGDAHERSYAPEHDEYWKSHVDQQSMKEHPSHDVLKHYVEGSSAFDAAHLIQNPHLPKESHGRLVSKVLNSPYKNNAGADIAKHIPEEHIDRFMYSTAGNTKIARGLAQNKNLNSDQLHHVIDTMGVGQTNIPGKRSLVDEHVVSYAMAHPNANDSHFGKLFELPQLMHSAPEEDKIEHTIEHSGALETISRRYHSEEIGKKLIDAMPSNSTDTLLGHRRIAANVARKHPHLLSGLSDAWIVNAVKTGGHANPNLEKVARDRNTPETLSAALGHTTDREFINQMKTHPHENVRAAAIWQEKMLDTKAATNTGD